MNTQERKVVVQSTRVAVAVEPRILECAWDKFPEPRGWALLWDGGALSETGQERDVAKVTLR